MNSPARGTAPTWLVCSLLALSVLAVYGQTLGFGFVSYDDTDYVVTNPEVQRGLSWEGLRWAFTSFDFANWFPLTWLSLMLDAEIAGGSPRMFHLTNLLLHTASTLLLFRVLDRATGARWQSAWVAALFARASPARRIGRLGRRAQGRALHAVLVPHHAGVAALGRASRSRSARRA